MVRTPGGEPIAQINPGDQLGHLHVSHQHDSQAVSKAFGGTRQVKPTDVEIMVITPEMRRQLAATTSL